MGGITEEEAERRFRERVRERQIWEQIGYRIRRARIAKGMSVDELAGKVGVSAPTLYRIEVGVMGTTMGHLKDLAQALGLGLADLVDPDDPTMARLRIAFRGRDLTPQQVDELLRYAQERFGPQRQEEPGDLRT
jgi:transcriptional regulator with XRE-family HTH domain